MKEHYKSWRRFGYRASHAWTLAKVFGKAFKTTLPIVRLFDGPVESERRRSKGER